MPQPPAAQLPIMSQLTAAMRHRPPMPQPTAMQQPLQKGALEGTPAPGSRCPAVLVPIYLYVQPGCTPQQPAPAAHDVSCGGAGAAPQAGQGVFAASAWSNFIAASTPRSDISSSQSCCSTLQQQPTSSHDSPQLGAAKACFPPAVDLPIHRLQQCDARNQTEPSTAGTEWEMLRRSCESVNAMNVQPGSRASSKAYAEVEESRMDSKKSMPGIFSTSTRMTAEESYMDHLCSMSSMAGVSSMNSMAGLPLTSTRSMTATWPITDDLHRHHHHHHEHHQQQLTTTSRGVVSSGGDHKTRRRPKKTKTWPIELQDLEEKQRRIREAREGEQGRDRILQETGKYRRDLESGSREVIAARITELCAVPGTVWHLSTDPEGCCIVQLALKEACGDARSRLCKEFHGRVKEAMGHPLANYVIQQIVEVMPVNIAGFVASELSNITAKASTHRHGCRIMCKLIQHFQSDPCVAKLEQELKPCEIGDLVRHSFGRRVMQAILEYGSDTFKHVIAMELAKNILGFSESRHGSYVLETALTYCCEADVEMLLLRLLKEELVHPMLQDQYGIYVMRTLLTLPRHLMLAVEQEVQNAPPEVKSNARYQQLMKLLKEGGWERR